MTIDILTVSLADDEIIEVFDGKNWKQVDFVYRARLVWSDSPLTEREVLVADLKGGGNKQTIWPIDQLPPFRIAGS